MTRRFRSKRFIPNRTLARKLVVFQLGSEKYAISIERVYRILNNFKLHGVSESGRSLISYNNEIITIIDPSQLLVSSRDDRERQYLIICTLIDGQNFGITVPEIPSVLEVAEDKFGDVPEIYQQGKVSDAIEKAIQLEDSKILFYLNLDKLMKNAIA
ncbi:MAG TPA: chemotaxis protein CheW [Leptolyngbyaceae cyanobacterium]